MNWLLIIVVAIILAGIILGWVRGGIRISLSLAATLFTLIVVLFASPFVSRAIIDLTPMDEVVENQCLRVMARITQKNEKKEELTEEKVLAILKGAGVSMESLEEQGITVEDIVSGSVTANDLTELGISAQIWKGHTTQEVVENILEMEIPRQQQMELIRNSKLPMLFKDILIVNNNSEAYAALGAKSFVQYIAKCMMKIVIDIIAFLFTFLIINIFIRALMFALDFVSDIPAEGTVNRLAGVGIGLCTAIIIIDVFFMGVTLLYTTQTGGALTRMISESEFLKFLFNNNYLLRIVTKIV